MNIIDAMMVNLSLEPYDAGPFRRFVEAGLNCLCELPQRLDNPRFEAALVGTDGAKVVFVRAAAPFEISWSEQDDTLFCGLVVSGGSNSPSPTPSSVAVARLWPSARPLLGAPPSGLGPISVPFSFPEGPQTGCSSA